MWRAATLSREKRSVPTRDSRLQTPLSAVERGPANLRFGLKVQFRSVGRGGQVHVTELLLVQREATRRGFARDGAQVQVAAFYADVNCGLAVETGFGAGSIRCSSAMRETVSAER